jgi:hypothetical protein
LAIIAVLMVLIGEAVLRMVFEDWMAEGGACLLRELNNPCPEFFFLAWGS